MSTLSASRHSRSIPGSSSSPSPSSNHNNGNRRVPKGDRVNLGHLVNFSLPPRDIRGGMNGGAGSSNPSGVPRRSRGRIGGSGSKDKYVNSQFRFVMKPTENYAAHFADPDLFFQWQNILQILVPTISPLSIAQGDESPSTSTSHHASSSSRGAGTGGGSRGSGGSEDAERRLRREKEKEGFLTCPICLDRPVAGRMTKCGHIFCFPCILHYFQLSDIPRSAKCPICGDTIESKFLKCIKWWDGDAGSLDMPDQDQDALGPGVGIDGGRTPMPHHAQLHHSHPYDHPELQHDSVLGELSEFDSASQSTPHRLRMRLIQRPQITTLALPRSTTWPSEALPQHQAPWHFLPDVMSFSKFMLATKDYMIEELQRDMRELEMELINLTGDELGKSFVEAAMRHVMGQMEKAKLELDSPLVRKGEKEAREAMEDVEIAKASAMVEEAHRAKRLQERIKKEEEERDASAEREETEGQAKEEMAALGDVPYEYLEAIGQRGLVNSSLALPRPVVEAIAETTTTTTAVGPPSSPSASTRTKARKNTTPARPSYSVDDPSYFFYQATSGAHIYLHPLDIKILLSHFKSYQSFPDYITIRPEGADGGSINDDLRRRCKYLAHLPAGTDVVFIEADLEEVVGSKVVEAFDQALKQRRSRRRDKIKKDDKAKARWEAKEREKLPLGLRNSPTPTSSSMELDEDFMIALQRSTLEVYGSRGFASTSPSTSFLSTTSYPPGLSASASNSRISPVHGDVLSTPSSSPSPNNAGAWLSPSSSSTNNNNNGRSFAAALHSTSPPLRIAHHHSGREEIRDPGIDEAWLAFERSAAAMVHDQKSRRNQSKESESSSLIQGTTTEGIDGGGGNGGGSPGGPGGSKIGKKKPKKIVLNMSGGGARRG